MLNIISCDCWSSVSSLQCMCAKSLHSYQSVLIYGQAPLPMGFSRQVYWKQLSCPPPGYFPNPGTEPTFLTSPAFPCMFFTSSITWEAPSLVYSPFKSSAHSSFVAFFFVNIFPHFISCLFILILLLLCFPLLCKSFYV